MKKMNACVWKHLRVSAILLLFFSSASYAQETGEAVTQAHSYLDSRTTSLQRYLRHSEKLQQCLLKKLQRKEHRYLKRLAAKDSALYYQYLQQNISYDSIARMGQDTLARSRIPASSPVIDSLKGIQRFAGQQQQKLNKFGATSSLPGADLPYTGQLNQLQAQISSQQNIDQLISSKTKALQNLTQNPEFNIKGLEGIRKDVFYAKEKIKTYKALADEPDKAEEQALEYLQGTEGFDKMLQPRNNAFGGLGNNATAEDLQRMGYQTKAQVNQLLQQKLGNSLGAIQQQMAGQVQGYMDELSGIAPVDDIKKGVQQAKATAAKAKEAAATAKETKSAVRNLNQPDFKINPEKGKPFWQRLEMQYNFQTARASVDGLKPAMMDLGAAVAYKQNQRLSFGIGLGLSTGLGQNWQHIRLSYEGLSIRTYADWKWIYGFSIQAGYERILRPANRAYLNENENNNNNNSNNNNNNPDTQPEDNALKTAVGGRQQVAYLGIMKRYKINSKWNGTFLAGYNILWQQEGMRSPWLLRFGWGK